jgi:hypothetical protein
MNLGTMSDKNKYEGFLKNKAIIDKKSGFLVSLSDLNPMLFDWQAKLVQWALVRGRAALFEDCGLGKTPQQLEWANQVFKKTGLPVLILAPLAVSEQTKREGDKFGIEVFVSGSKSEVIEGINITNYEKLHKFDPSVFSGIVLDESSILKNFSGTRRNEIIDAFETTPYKLACTATPAPNDYMELGNHSEFLNVLTRSEMLATFFINDTAHVGHWRLKGHVRDNIFWKWLSSWSIMITKPSDIGYDDDGFILPDIHYCEHLIKSSAKPKKGFFVQKAETLNERREVRRDSIEIKGKQILNLIGESNDSWVMWCNLNAEGDCLERNIKNSVQVAGRHPEEVKVKRMVDFAFGQEKIMITKPKIAGLGMNWQICNKAVFMGLSDSWEQFYQAIRRIWRFGQNREVEIHIFLEEREGNVLENIKRKDQQAREMIKNMVVYMKDLMKSQLEQSGKEFIGYNPTEEMELPKWIR